MTDARLTPRLLDRVGGVLTGPGWRRVVMIRRVAAAGLVILALVLAVTPRSGSVGVMVVVAATDLTAGSTVRPGDLAVREWPTELVPGGAVHDPATAQGRVLVGAARAGEALTDVRLLGADHFATAPSAAGPDGAAVPVRLADAGVAALLVPGSRVDVVMVGEHTDRPVVLAGDAIVLAVLEPESGSRGRLVMVAMPRDIATRVAAAALADQVAVTLR